MKLLLLVLLVSVVAGLLEEPTKERKCVPQPKKNSLGLDLKWFGSVKEFFLPMWSQLYATRTASDILEREAARIANHEIDPASCLVFKQENTVSAYGRVQNYNISGDADSIHFKSPWSGRFLGRTFDQVSSCATCSTRSSWICCIVRI
ncbi:hypothetical protein Fcan01_17294 [Folsomia candida]|uniref:Uncharacterized protein n=1 Tax=Folsomia candida TaxID=158441 RepID=A0A226DR20_FOLCA|nr:hypothetical protein Fcan01_17294 [Folsomia candida]